MASISENQAKLLAQLAEMFQFDQADLDFGIYRIMNYKRAEIKRFLQDDLIAQISVQLAKLSQSFYGAEPDKSAQAMAAAEADIYAHLTEFFSRYYDEGDFISQRRYKEGVYAIPYEGEEVKLYWANADQFYIKTSEYFRDYTFTTDSGAKVHFKMIEAETEKDNNKGKTRFFQLYQEKPFTLENGELIIYFEYKTGNKKNQTNCNEEVVAEFAKAASQYPDFSSLLTVLGGKSLLKKQLSRYTARNTFDYFIHKDLGNFLNRELVFYIKNEVVFLDDIDEQDERIIKEILVKAKIIRSIGTKIITFLAQIENFQKKLWLKKKFVVEAHYCITLDRVPHALYPQIIVNKAQVAEWKRLFAIQEIQTTGGRAHAALSAPLSIAFLEQNPYLVLDTAFFSAEFKEQLVESIENLDDTLDGLLIQSENFQALNLLVERYQKQVQCMYIDPPYNAKSSEILYKNNYKHSSWLSLIENRLILSKFFINHNSVYIAAIDEVENEKLGLLFDDVLSAFDGKTVVAVVINPSGQQGKNFSTTHEYLYFYYSDTDGRLAKEFRDDAHADIRGFMNGAKGEGLNYRRESGRNCFYPIYVKNNAILGFGAVCAHDFHPQSANVPCPDGAIAVYPVDADGIERKWLFERGTVEKINHQLSVKYNKKRNEWEIIRTKKLINYKTVWHDAKYSAKEHGTHLLTRMFGKSPFSFPKSIHAVRDCLYIATKMNTDAIIMDYFAGSGTTGHAVINLNREDGGRRKYILVEMGEYFDAVTKPRIQKIIYSMDTADGTKGWKDGKPVSRKGSSHIFRYLRLESYEDTLNNIELDDGSLTLIDNPAVKEQYILHYMLSHESKGSASLLNIDMLAHPFNYAMRITRKQESKIMNIDLVETFNYLIGLQVERNHALRSFAAEFTTGEYGAVAAELRHGTTYRFKIVEGTLANGDRTLVIWRDLTGDIIKDNAVLDAFVGHWKIYHGNFEYKKVYVNGGNNLLNLRSDNENWEVILIEEEMKKRMFSMEPV